MLYGIGFLSFTQKLYLENRIWSLCLWAESVKRNDDRLEHILVAALSERNKHPRSC